MKLDWQTILRTLAAVLQDKQLVAKLAAFIVTVVGSLFGAHLTSTGVTAVLLAVGAILAVYEMTVGAKAKPKPPKA